ncbi:MAG: DUF5060 domain-containing protein [Crocinitomicaceae bacterium]
MKKIRDRSLLSIDELINCGMKSIATLFSICFSLSVLAQSSDSVKIKLMNNEPVDQWSRTEVGISLPKSLEKAVTNFVEKKGERRINPFLEWEIKVEATFSSPSGKSFTIDGFYFESFDSQMKNFMPPKNGLGYSDDEYVNLGQFVRKDNKYLFRARIAPDEEGEWTCQVRVLLPDETYTSNLVTILVKPAEGGFLSVGENGRFLKRGNKSFFPVGCNMPWPQTSDKIDPELFSRMKQRMWDGKIGAITEAYKSVYIIPRVYDIYRKHMKEYADGGMNTFRTIMYPTGTEIEWEELGDYSRRMHMAYELDNVLGLAENEDVMLFWNLQIHYTFQYAKNAYGVNWSWDRKMNGFDFCYKSLLENDDPLEFFKNEEAKKYYKQRLRYIMSRWGYSANIGVFELFSEISNVGTQKADHNDFYRTADNWKPYRDWQVEMADYLKTLHQGKIHLITGSFAGERVEDDNVYEAKSMDVMSSNIYNFGVYSWAQFWIDYVAKRHLDESGNSGNSYTLPNSDNNRRNVKPLIYSETDPVLMEIKCDSFTVEFDRSLWQSSFSGLAGSLSWMQWFKTGDSETYKCIAQFMDGVDLDGEQWHPGASKLDLESGAWVYEDKFAAKMAGWVKPGLFKKRRMRQADLIYMRSGDSDEAMGVLTNLTWNVYTTSDCYDEEFEATFDFDRLKSSGRTELKELQVKKEKLQVKGLSKGEHTLTFYSTLNPLKPIRSVSFKGKKAKFKDVKLGVNKQNAMVLFKISSDTPEK